MLRRGGRYNDNEQTSPVVVYASAGEDDDDEDVFSSEVESEDEDEDYRDDTTSGSGGEASSDDEGEKHKEKSREEDDESLCERVNRLLREKRSLEGNYLRLIECKAYLRRHGLRVGGTKAVCVQRISEHWRVKDGKGEEIYPISSFVFNCTGDVCKGDVVLFTQKVYGRFDKVTRHGKILGRRTIAGRVVKESYGSAKQQHTFTVEVLWSKGVNKLPPLFPLLVKGRNLYKMKTLRQTWTNELERQKFLEEKHKRGSEARRIRAIRISKKLDSSKGGRKNSRPSQHTRHLQTKRTAEAERQRIREKARPCLKGTNSLEVGQNFQRCENIHPNLHSNAQYNHPPQYIIQHGTAQQCSYNFQGTMSTTVPLPPIQHRAYPPTPASYGHFFKPTNDVRYSNFNQSYHLGMRNTGYIPEAVNNVLVSRVPRPREAYQPSQRGFRQHENRTGRAG